ncbi:MAG: hypothetical protein DCC55_05615 [Chloroflexi bacterium]|nr:MAG: hypothetical protein DCC55_05615 [Chloroflexota bacterium]
MKKKDKPKVVEPLPEAFATEEEAGEFWDTHSTMDYLGYLEPTDDVIDLQHRVFEVEIEEDIFDKLQQEAEAQQKPVPEVLDHILRQALAVA